MTPQTREWLLRPELTRLWDRLKDRLESNGLQVRGRLRLDDVAEDEREALCLLLGRIYSGPVVSIALAGLDEQLRVGSTKQGLVEVVEALRGPLISRPALKDARRAAKESVWTAAGEALRRRGLDLEPWPRLWMADVRRGGTLARLQPDHAAQLITQAVDVLAALTLSSATHDRRELAERVTGTAHGLDDGTLLSRLVLRALARAKGQNPPADARDRRELWQTFGVASDQVSSTVLTYGLMPQGEGWADAALRQRSSSHAETHLSLRDLRRVTWRLAADTEVFVCENPRIVEAATDLHCGRPLVCTSGNPTTVVRELLDALAAAGARLAYRGDFDWPGLAMANRIIDQYDARHWRMSAADYEEQVATARRRGTPLQPLAGTPIEACWDPELTAAMIAVGLAVQEESAIGTIIADLAPSPDLPERSG